MTLKPTCYMCAAAKTSREHAPPKCLFPEEIENGCELRRNLITVPSCDEHNSKKSKDDEFLRVVILVSSVAASEMAKNQFMGKLLRAVARKPRTYSQFFCDEGTLANGALHALRIDRGRFEKCIDHIARAMFYDTYNAKWDLPSQVISPNFLGLLSKAMLCDISLLKMLLV
jgi:hypothetical protein